MSMILNYSYGIPS